MTEIFAYLKEMGFTPGGYGIWSIAMMLAAWLTKEWREQRKLTAYDRQARREGFSKQVEMLQAENRRLLEDQSKLRREYDEYRHICQIETDNLREMLIGVQGELAGYRRRIDTLSLVVADQVAGATPGEKALLDRIDKRTGG